RIAAEVLGLEPAAVGIHDNVFELGLDSIQGIRLAARARQAGLELSPAQVFQHPTIAALAAVAAAAGPVAPEPAPTAPPAPGADRTPADFPLARLDPPALARLLDGGPEVEDIYPPSPVQEGMIFHSLYEP